LLVWAVTLVLGIIIYLTTKKEETPKNMIVRIKICIIYIAIRSLWDYGVHFMDETMCRGYGGFFNSNTYRNILT
jgi:hypothetical protein